MKKIYLVHLNSEDHEPEYYYWDRIIAVFDTKEKAEQFCINNSDEQSESNKYEIFKRRKFMIENKCVFDLNGEMIIFDDCWLNIEEMEMY